MEAFSDQLADSGGSTAVLTHADRPVGGASNGGAAERASAGTADAGLAALLAAVNAAAAAAPAWLAMAGYVESAHFAGDVEDISRTVEYLQILAAGSVDRTRTRAIADAATARTRSTRTWVTGWDHGAETLNETDSTWPAGPAPTSPAAASPAASNPATEPIPNGPAAPVVSSPADDGCANAAEFLRVRLRIGKSEAHRRLALARAILPVTTLTGETTPPPREHLAAGLTPTTHATAADGAENGADDAGDPAPLLACPAVSSRAGTIISLTLDRLQHRTTPETLTLIETDLTRTAATADPDFLARVARRWSDTLDADGTEPSEEALRHTQGAFIRKPRHGLHHLEIFATTDQYEHLLTVMNTATNPRTTTTTTTTGTSSSTATSSTCRIDGDIDGDMGADIGGSTGNGTDPGPGPGTGTGQDRWADADADVELDRRTRSQKQLDGIIGALKAALRTDTLPITGGNRPQILATIHYQDLLPHPADATTTAPTTGTNITTETRPGTGTEPGTETGIGIGTRTETGTRSGTGNYTFTGPVAATTLRKLACDADIIPVLLGTNSEILDLGRKTRLFTPAQRLALTARDQGCTFPNCTIPAPWCEAHHITYWSNNGPTNTTNGTLLCSHHHHLIHKEQWTITTQHGTPWYTPPRHIDPTQKPQQNHYFKPPPPPQRE